MSTYGINKVNHLLQVDPGFRQQMATDPAAAIEAMPLTAEERDAILAGDVATLYRLGAHTFLMSRIPRFLPDFLTRDDYIGRLRTTLTSDERVALGLDGGAGTT